MPRVGQVSRMIASYPNFVSVTNPRHRSKDSKMQTNSETPALPPLSAKARRLLAAHDNEVRSAKQG